MKQLCVIDVVFPASSVNVLLFYCKKGSCKILDAIPFFNPNSICLCVNSRIKWTLAVFRYTVYLSAVVYFSKSS